MKGLGGGEEEEGGGERDEPEDLEDLVDFWIAGNEGKAGSHLGEDGSAGPDVDLCRRRGVSGWREGREERESVRRWCSVVRRGGLREGGTRGW
jgi:hypothetical protein